MLAAAGRCRFQVLVLVFRTRLALVLICIVSCFLVLTSSWGKLCQIVSCFGKLVPQCHAEALRRCEMKFTDKPEKAEVIVQGNDLSNLQQSIAILRGGGCHHQRHVDGVASEITVCEVSRITSPCTFRLCFTGISKSELFHMDHDKSNL